MTERLILEEGGKGSTVELFRMPYDGTPRPPGEYGTVFARFHGEPTLGIDKLKVIVARMKEMEGH